MKNVTRRAVAIRLGPFLFTLIVSLLLSFAHLIYVTRQAGFVWAAHEGNISRMRVLYALGVNVNEAACKGRGCMTPLVSAGWGGHLDAIQFVLDRGAEVNKTGKFGKTALMMAAYSGDDECVEFLLSRGADLNLADQDGNTALSFAKQRNRQTTVEVLRRAGASENP